MWVEGEGGDEHQETDRVREQISCLIPRPKCCGENKKLPGLEGWIFQWSALGGLVKKLTFEQGFKELWDFANKGPSSQGYGFSSSHVWMWELDP